MFSQSSVVSGQLPEGEASELSVQRELIGLVADLAQAVRNLKGRLAVDEQIIASQGRMLSKQATQLADLQGKAVRS